MKLGMLFVMSILMISFALAGVGIEWGEKAVVIGEGDTLCMTYKLYNPWPDASEVKVTFEGELSPLLKSQKEIVASVPADTSSGEGIPVEVCFEAPVVYEGDCSIPKRSYSGEIVVSGEPSKNAASVTMAAVSVPLTIDVGCDESDRNYTLGYVLLAFFSVIGMVVFISRRSS